MALTDCFLDSLRDKVAGPLSAGLVALQRRWRDDDETSKRNETVSKGRGGRERC